VSDSEPQFLEIGPTSGYKSRRIAYIAEPPVASPRIGLFWLSGFKSDMASTKATALATFAREKGYGFTGFDYSGHGLSSGRFEDGTIGAWLEEAETVFHSIPCSRQIVIGSSMGGHIALLLLRRLLRSSSAEVARIAALVLIAPAWDMTEELMWKAFSKDERDNLMATGVFLQPSEYGEPYAITRELIEEGRNHLFARKPFDPGRPVVILQGLQDQDVPIAHARALMQFLKGGWAEMIEIPDGEHRLSRPQDLDLLFGAIEGLAAYDKG
jgi:pimeloyl-ACP methyl ester carboxylesterase